MPTTAFGENPAIGFLSVGKAGLRQRRAMFDLMVAAWNGGPAINLNQELFTSVHSFEREPLKAFQDAQGGKCDGLQSSGIGHACPWIIWDFDSTPEQALLDAETLVLLLISIFDLDASADVLRLNLSGSKGCHLRLWNPLFDPNDIEFDPNTFRKHKAFALSLANEAGVTCDPAIYSVGNLIRLPNSKHPKTGRHAVPVSIQSLLGHDHDAIVGPVETPWNIEPLRTQRFLWPTGQFEPRFAEVFAERWNAAAASAEQCSEPVEVRRAEFKPEGGSFVSFKMPYETQRILSGDAVVGEGASRHIATFKLGCQSGERGLSLRGSWWLFREAILGCGLDEREAMKRFHDGWKKGLSDPFPGHSDESFTNTLPR
jgi:hypothetical protein